MLITQSVLTITHDIFTFPPPSWTRLFWSCDFVYFFIWVCFLLITFSAAVPHNVVSSSKQQSIRTLECNKPTNGSSIISFVCSQIRNNNKIRNCWSLDTTWKCSRDISHAEGCGPFVINLGRNSFWRCVCSTLLDLTLLHSAEAWERCRVYCRYFSITEVGKFEFGKVNFFSKVWYLLMSFFKEYYFGAYHL